MKRFEINGKEYIAKAFDFNLVCDLEDMGISVSTAQDKPMSTARAYFALCTGRGKVYAGQELEAHIANGGDFNEIMEVMSEEMEKSDFFRSLAKTEITENGKNQSKAK